MLPFSVNAYAPAVNTFPTAISLLYLGRPGSKGTKPLRPPPKVVRITNTARGPGRRISPSAIPLRNTHSPDPLFPSLRGRSGGVGQPSDTCVPLRGSHLAYPNSPVLRWGCEPETAVKDRSRRWLGGEWCKIGRRYRCGGSLALVDSFESLVGAWRYE